MMKIIQYLIVMLLLSASSIKAEEMSQVPLFLGTAVDPNVMFLLDNSGSMVGEVIISEAGYNYLKQYLANNNNGSNYFYQDGNSYYYPSYSTSSYGKIPDFTPFRFVQDTCQYFSKNGSGFYACSAPTFDGCSSEAGTVEKDGVTYNQCFSNTFGSCITDSSGDYDNLCTQEQKVEVCDIPFHPKAEGYDWTSGTDSFLYAHYPDDNWYKCDPNQYLASYLPGESYPWGTKNGYGWIDMGTSVTKKELAQELEQLYLLCFGYNKMAYNPNFEYEPWHGTDYYNNEFINQDKGPEYNGEVKASYARKNPYHVDLDYINDHVYLKWIDADHDNTFDAGECGISVDWNNLEITVDPDNLRRIRDLSPQERSQYGNWYSYYRSREFTAKKAATNLIQQTNSMNMGMTLLWSSASSSYVLKDQNNQYSTVARPLRQMSSETNKADLLKSIVRIKSNSGTPLRTRLLEVGRYFHDNQQASSSILGFSDNVSVFYSQEEGGACQQNFAIVMSDGYWNGSNPSYSYIKNNDGGAGCNDATPTEFDNVSQMDDRSCEYADDIDTLADIAMYYYENDLAPNLDDAVPKKGDDNNPAQHLVTYTVAFGLSGYMTDDDVPIDRETPANNGTTDKTVLEGWKWKSNSKSAVDDMRHAAWNGRGEYLEAYDSEALITGLENALNAIAERIGSVASVSFDSHTIDTDTHVYIGSFNTFFWTGDIAAYQFLVEDDEVKGIVDQNGDKLIDSNDAIWSAADNLDAVDYIEELKVKQNNGEIDDIEPLINAKLTEIANNRVILTYNPTSGQGISFRSDDTNWSLLTETQRADLRTDDAGNQEGNDITAKKRLDYLRGVPSSTTDSFRDRKSRLGDIVSSGSVYVQAPILYWPDNLETVPYTDYKKAKTKREAVIYVGANDGMLHAFKAEDGQEILAYIPHSLFSSEQKEGLHYLSNDNYVHRYYVDETPRVSDAYIKTKSSSSKAWHTILIGALRAGGKGIFALDITDPTQFSDDNADDIVMWEFSADDDVRMGHSIGKPTVAKLNNGKWAVIFGNGYDNGESGSNYAHLFILYIEEGLDGIWSSSDYEVISIPEYTNNGLSEPVVADIDKDGIVDLAYAGDLHGNIWKFNLVNFTKTLLYEGEVDYALQPYQPITATPALAFNPEYNVFPTIANPNLIVLVGTGRYLKESDKEDNSQQVFLGVWDNGNTYLDQGDLVKQEILTTDDGEYRYIQSKTVDYSAGDHGWYLEFPDEKASEYERVVYDAAIRGDIVYFNTIIPAGGSRCSDESSGWLMSIDVTTGGAPSSAAFDTDDDWDIDSDDTITLEDGTEVNPIGESLSNSLPGSASYIENYQVIGNADSIVPDVRTIVGVEGQGAGRISWQQLFRE